MKRSSTARATHVNTGTSIPRTELGSSVTHGREFRHPKLQVGLESSSTTALGGLALAARLAVRLRMAQTIDERVSLLRSRRPFHESDHVLTHAYNLFVGGTAIEDIADLQHSETRTCITSTATRRRARTSRTRADSATTRW